MSANDATEDVLIAAEKVPICDCRFGKIVIKNEDVWLEIFFRG